MPNDQRALPVFEGSSFDRPAFDQFLSSHPGAISWQVRIDDVDAVMIVRGGPDALASVTCVRRVKFEGPVAPDHFQRVTIFDDGVLRASPTSADDRALIEAIFACARPVLEQQLREREARIAHAVASAPALHRPTLEAAIQAMTHGRVDSARIAAAVISAAADPRAYVERRREACRDFGVFEPVKRST